MKYLYYFGYLVLLMYFSYITTKMITTMNTPVIQQGATI